ncbi:MAG: FliM/FliN family flagellar motor switch protein [Bacillota bacterium]
MTEEEIRRFLSKLNHETVAQVTKVRFPELDSGSTADFPVKTGIRFLEDVKVDLVAELGEATLKVKDVLNLQVGTVIELDRPAGDAVDLVINNQRVARGEVLVLNELFGLRISAIYQPRRLKGEGGANGQ